MSLNISEQTEKVVYLLRHGQSEDNASPVFQGPDSPLSEHGRQQAQFIAERVRSIEFDALISSPFHRARQTADAIAAATDKTVELSDLFVERIKPSSINGQPYSNAAASDVWQQWEASFYESGNHIEDGENFDSITKRARAALDYLYNRPERTFVVTSHGYFIRSIIATVLLADELTPSAARILHRSMFGMENTGMTVLLYEPAFQQEARWRLWSYNDHAHLAE